MARTKWSNQWRRRRNGYPGRGGSLLSNDQKASIAIEARKAYDRQQTFLPFEDWRKHEQYLALNPAQRAVDQTSRLSLTDCTNADYLKLLGHFQNLAGRTGRAVKTFMRDDVEPARIAMFKLKEACAERGLALAYPLAICRHKYKCELEEANAKQIWNLVFDVRSRRGPSRTGTKQMEAPF